MAALVRFGRRQRCACRLFSAQTSLDIDGFASSLLSTDRSKRRQMLQSKANTLSSSEQLTSLLVSPMLQRADPRLRQEVSGQIYLWAKSREMALGSDCFVGMLDAMQSHETELCFRLASKAPKRGDPAIVRALARACARAGKVDRALQQLGELGSQTVSDYNVYVLGPLAESDAPLGAFAAYREAGLSKKAGLEPNLETYDAMLAAHGRIDPSLLDESDAAFVEECIDDLRSRGFERNSQSYIEMANSARDDGGDSLGAVSSLTHRAVAEGIDLGPEYFEVALGLCCGKDNDPLRAVNELVSIFEPAMRAAEHTPTPPQLVALAELFVRALRRCKPASHAEWGALLEACFDGVLVPSFKGLRVVDEDEDVLDFGTSDDAVVLPPELGQTLVRELCARGEWARALEVCDLMLDSDSSGPDSAVWPMLIEGTSVSKDPSDTSFTPNVEHCTALMDAVNEVGKPAGHVPFYTELYRRSHNATLTVLLDASEPVWEKAAGLLELMDQNGVPRMLTSDPPDDTVMGIVAAFGPPEFVDTKNHSHNTAQRFVRYAYIPESAVGFVIGPKGANINAIRAESGAFINVSNKGAGRGDGEVREVLIGAQTLPRLREAQLMICESLMQVHTKHPRR